MAKRRNDVGGRSRSPGLGMAVPFGLPTLVGILLLLATGCQRDKIEPEDSFPDDVAKLMRKTCATKGCHNDQSYEAAAGLNLSSWAKLFEGSRGGSPVIPYAPELSFLLFSVNADPSLGPTLSPTMPYNDDVLSPEEYNLLWQWIDEGARNAKDEERFPPDPSRSKWYVGHNQCDQVAVFDAESRQIMRYVDVGAFPASIELAFDIKVTPDGKDWLVLFSGINENLERYSTLTDEKVADIPLGIYGWNTFEISPDSRFAFVCSDYWRKLAVVDLESNALVAPPRDFATEVFGPVVHPQRPEVYLVQHLRQHLYAMDYDDNGTLGNPREIDLVQGIAPSKPGTLLPHAMQFLPDGSKYFVSCWNSHEVRVFDGDTDSLLDVIEMPAGPLKMAYSSTTGRLFVSCMDDLASWPGASGRRGSVVAVNAASHQVEKVVYTGFQPYAMVVDDQNGVLAVVNRNTDVTGPAPHHVSTCGDRNGYLTLINLLTLNLVPNYKTEILVDPLTIARK